MPEASSRGQTAAPDVGPANVEALTAAQEFDIAQAEELLADHEPEVVVTDRGDDKKALVEEIGSRGARAVVPPPNNRTVQRDADPHWYRGRNLCERFWGRPSRPGG